MLSLKNRLEWKKFVSHIILKNKSHQSAYTTRRSNTELNWLVPVTYRIFTLINTYQQLTIKSTSPDMTLVFDVRFDDGFMETKAQPLKEQPSQRE